MAVASLLMGSAPGLLAQNTDPEFSTLLNRRLGDPPPQVTPDDRDVLMRRTRQWLAQAVRGEPLEPASASEAMNDVNCPVAVTVRRRGQILATADVSGLPLTDACRKACVDIAAQREKGEPVVTMETLSDTGIELELVGPRQRIGTGMDSAAQLAQSFEPAIHGISVWVNDREILIRPSQLMSREVIRTTAGASSHDNDRHEAAIESLQRKIGLFQEPPKVDPRGVVIARFRTTHLYELAPGRPAVELAAGMRFIHPAEVTRDAVIAQADLIARYIGFRQISDGTFSYEFLPGRNMYWPYDQNWVRQAATAWSMAHYARQTGDKTAADVADSAIAAFAKMAKGLQGNPRAKFIDPPDREPALGVTALVCLAMIDAPNHDRYAPLCRELMNGLAAMQKEDGSFRTYFPDHADSGSQDYYPGEALLAISKYYALTRDAKWRDICDKALPYYLTYFRISRPAMFVPWQAQAWGYLARTTKLQRYADFVFEMNDVIVQSQIQFADPGLAVYLGGLDVHHIGRTGISTAVYIEGLIEGVRTAEAFGDKPRAAQYRGVIRRALRFVMQLCWREEECYYVWSPKEVLGGVRNSLAAPTLRIDNMQHALSAFAGAIEVLTDEDWMANTELGVREPDPVESSPPPSAP